MSDWTYKQITEMANTIARLTRERDEAKDAIDHLSRKLECAERRVQSVALASGFTSNNYDGLVSHIARLRETVEKLPKTADGVPVVPGMELWVVTDSDGIQSDEPADPWPLHSYNGHDVSDAFSSITAAEAARSNTHGQ